MFVRFTVVAWACFLLLSPGPVCGQVVLNEVLADPARDWDGDGSLQSRDDEWVEICNAGSSLVDLSQYRLASADTSWRYEFSGTLEPGAVTVVYGSESYSWEQVSGNPAYGLRLANGGGEITLWKVVGSSMTLVDCYIYTDHEAEDDRSSGRYPDGAALWVLFDSLNPYTGTEKPTGSNCAPSPGTSSACTTPVEKTSWGNVKSLWATGVTGRHR